MEVLYRGWLLDLRWGQKNKEKIHYCIKKLEKKMYCSYHIKVSSNRALDISLKKRTRLNLTDAFSSQKNNSWQSQEKVLYLHTIFVRQLTIFSDSFHPRNPILKIEKKNTVIRENKVYFLFYEFISGNRTEMILYIFQVVQPRLLKIFCADA